MLLTIIQILIIFVVFIPVSWLSFKVTEEWGLPKWLQYKPFICRTCLTFWTLLAIYVAIGLIFGANVTLWGGIALTILNAIAMYINQKNKTIKIE